MDPYESTNMPSELCFHTIIHRCGVIAGICLQAQVRAMWTKSRALTCDYVDEYGLCGFADVGNEGRQLVSW